jgi:hypothetical protein
MISGRPVNVLAGHILLIYGKATFGIMFTVGTYKSIVGTVEKIQ